MRKSRDPFAVAEQQGIVEVIFGADFGDDRRRGLVAGDGERGVAGQQLLQRKDDDGDEEDRRHHQGQSLEQETQHGGDLS